MDKNPLTDTRNIINKLPGHLDRSGAISSQLRTQEDGGELYDRVQQSELDLRTAREACEAGLAAWANEKQEFDSHLKKLTGLIRVGAEVCSLFGIEIANDVLKADAADPQASATHIAHYVSRVTGFGEGLAQGIASQRARFLESELALKNVQASADASGRALASAYYRAVSVVAQAKAFLSANGVVVRDRKPSPRPRKKPLAVVPAANSIGPIMLTPIPEAA